MEKENKFSSATELYEQALQIAVDKEWIYFNLLKTMENSHKLLQNVLPLSFRQKHIEIKSHLARFNIQLDAVLANFSLMDSAIRNSEVFYALFIAAHYSDEYEVAWKYLDIANNYEFKRRNSNRYAKREIAGLTSVFTSSFFDSIPKNNLKKFADVGKFITNISPIFIIAPPGSGVNTLIQMLTTHKSIKYWNKELDYYMGRFQNGPKLSVFESNFEKFNRDLINGLQTQQDIKKILKDYSVDMLKEGLARSQYEKKSDMKYYIDTSYDLITHIGYIQVLFPNAVIINVVRSPMDMYYDAYRSFPIINELTDYVLNNNTLLKYFQDYFTLLQHWNKELGSDRIININMDKLVENPKKELKPLLKLLKLSWHENMNSLFSNTVTEVELEVDGSSEISNDHSANSNSISIFNPLSPKGTWKLYEEQLMPIYSKLTEYVSELDSIYGEPIEETVIPEKMKRGKKFSKKLHKKSKK